MRTGSLGSSLSLVCAMLCAAVAPVGCSLLAGDTEVVPGDGHGGAALALAGVDPDKLKAEGKGKNKSPALAFLAPKKT